jgi:hypothetical protein
MTKPVGRGTGFDLLGEALHDRLSIRVLTYSGDS